MIYNNGNILLPENQSLMSSDVYSYSKPKVVDVESFLNHNFQEKKRQFFEIFQF